MDNDQWPEEDTQVDSTKDLVVTTDEVTLKRREISRLEGEICDAVEEMYEYHIDMTTFLELVKLRKKLKKEIEQ